MEGILTISIKKCFSALSKTFGELNFFRLVCGKFSHGSKVREC